ncbi:MAG: 3-dehydroquinate synthase, partial [Gammaproteobacteria bacterium]|nr:3-dehydroquinate synthase [Gammaproteobacteria bacterium]
MGQPDTLTVTVDLGERSYPIRIGRGLLGQPGLLDPFLAGSQALVVTNEVVGEHYLDRTLAGLPAHVRADVLALPDGEAFKTLATFSDVIDRLVAGRHNRGTTIIALGGGVVGDVAGFAAAAYQRGVPYIQVPTTLLALVDSSVGGKTAVNHPGGKNLVGAFYQPRCVVADLDTLDTLPDRELRAGLAEVIKYGVIFDADFFDWIAAHLSALLARDMDSLGHAVARSCEIKAEVVRTDERESGVRMVLNYGHTFGHALEAVTGYASLLHGEAVAIGMVLAAELAARLGTLPAPSAA